MVRLDRVYEEKVTGSNNCQGERMHSGIVQERAHPVIEAIKRDASTRPLEYVLNYVVPAEGE